MFLWINRDIDKMRILAHVIFLQIVEFFFLLRVWTTITKYHALKTSLQVADHACMYSSSARSKC